MNTFFLAYINITFYIVVAWGFKKRATKLYLGYRSIDIIAHPRQNRNATVKLLGGQCHGCMEEFPSKIGNCSTFYCFFLSNSKIDLVRAFWSKYWVENQNHWNLAGNLYCAHSPLFSKEKQWNFKFCLSAHTHTTAHTCQKGHFASLDNTLQSM